MNKVNKKHVPLTNTTDVFFLPYIEEREAFYSNVKAGNVIESIRCFCEHTVTKKPLCVSIKHIVHELLVMEAGYSGEEPNLSPILKDEKLCDVVGGVMFLYQMGWVDVLNGSGQSIDNLDNLPLDCGHYEIQVVSDNAISLINEVNRMNDEAEFVAKVGA